MEVVRAADRDRYLSVLYAPEEKRASLFALYAFNAEIAAVRDRIRKALPGEIRLQWWRDAIANGEAGGHPLADALLAERPSQPPQEAFDDYLEARIFDLYDDPMPGRAELEGYCGETACTDPTRSTGARPAVRAVPAEAAGHAGCAQAITGLIRLIPMHRARGQCYVPRDVLAAAGSSPEAFVAGTDAASARRAIAAMAALAAEHLAASRAAPAPPPVAAAGFSAAGLDARLSHEDRRGRRGSVEPKRRHLGNPAALADVPEGVAWVGLIDAAGAG